MYISLEPRHKPPDFGLVHKREGDTLEVPEHGAPEIKEDLLPYPGGQTLLGEIRRVVYSDNPKKGKENHQKGMYVCPNPIHGKVDRRSDDKRDGKLGGGKNENRDEGEEKCPLIWLDIREETEQYSFVKHPAKKLLIPVDL